MNRRMFLRGVAGAGSAAAVFGQEPVRGCSGAKIAKRWWSRSGAARATSLHLLLELVPEATFFSNVVNEGILEHYVCSAINPFAVESTSCQRMDNVATSRLGRRYVANPAAVTSTLRSVPIVRIMLILKTELFCGPQDINV
jgi:hypothetical protein